MKTQGGTLCKSGKRRTSMKISMKSQLNYKKRPIMKIFQVPPNSPKFPQIPQNSKTTRNFIIFNEILGV